VRVVAIGGGTGLSTLLRGLREHVESALGSNRDRLITDLGAIVTVTDDGGSSGRLRREFNMIPPGDVRRCLVALSQDEDLLSRLFEYRFRAGKGLEGHSLGNLLLTALTKITGDFGRALEVASEVLATCGHIYPATLQHVRLRAELEGGRIVTGETRISRSTRRIARLMLVPAGCRPVPDAMYAIDRADIITLGPGSLYTSIIPNVLVRGLARRIAASKAVKVYVGNLMTQPGETTGMTSSEHIRAVYDHAGEAFFNYAVLNGANVSPRLSKRYRSQGSTQVENDLDDIARLGVEPVLHKLIARGNVVRHNPEVLAQAVLNLGTVGTVERT
jgi:uncharacterized cofD-like protein